MEDVKKHDIGIIIVTYNSAAFIKKQVELIRRFSIDPVDIIIVDNSTDDSVVRAILYYNEELGCRYLKTYASSTNGSDSHAFAANLAYTKYRDDYKMFFFLDHDCFPIKPFSIRQMLDGMAMVGVGQNKGGIEYFWPGCVMWKSGAEIAPMIDFSPNKELQLDTGGGLHHIVEKFGVAGRIEGGKCRFLNEEHVQNPNFNKGMYNFYVFINERMFMHFINGSSWNPSEANEERINSLLNILNEITK